MPAIPGLRSPYEKVGRLVYFGRMLDKIRLHAEGRLPAEYRENLGDSQPGMFDTRCCEFLRVPYEEIKRRTLAGGTDEAVLAWAEQRGIPRAEGECYIWNRFLAKRGWRDGPTVSERLRQRVEESRLTGQPIETFFDFIDFDEGRDPVAARSWEKI